MTGQLGCDQPVEREEFGFEPVRSLPFGVADGGDAFPQDPDRGQADQRENPDRPVLDEGVADRVHLLLCEQEEQHYTPASGSGGFGIEVAAGRTAARMKNPAMIGLNTA